MDHSAGDLDSNLLTELQQLRHWCSAPVSFIICPGPRNSEKGAFVIAIVASSRHTRETNTLCSSLLASSSTATPELALLQSATTSSYICGHATMGQPRLNHVMVTAVHRGKIEQFNVDKIMTEFVLRNDERRKKHLLFRTDDALSTSTVQFCWQTLSLVLGRPIVSVCELNEHSGVAVEQGKT